MAGAVAGPARQDRCIYLRTYTNVSKIERKKKKKKRKKKERKKRKEKKRKEDHVKYIQGKDGMGCVPVRFLLTC